MALSAMFEVKHCVSMSDPFQAKNFVISYKIVSKQFPTNGNSIWMYYIILTKYEPFKCMFKLHFQFGPFLTSYMSLDINYQASVLIFILTRVMTFLH